MVVVDTHAPTANKCLPKATSIMDLKFENSKTPARRRVISLFYFRERESLKVLPSIFYWMLLQTSGECYQVE